ncbi:MAG TPA: signal peptide peptidase SppA, partial [Bacteroidota bacterium]|nr:signal peptide peptidase SppA [Bacteroidota bacterium]
STKWFIGILAVLAVLAIGFTVVIFALISSSGDRTETVTEGSGDRIAVVDLRGEIMSSDAVVRQLKRYRADRSVKAILLHIDSPGGGVVASQEMYEEVRRTRDDGKPVIVSMGALAASGGYYVACGGTRLVANRGTLTGSIGVISEFLQLKEALDKLGIAINTIKAGKLKDAGSPARKMTDDDRTYFQRLMDDVHTQFIDVVVRERKLSRERIRELADGRVFTGEEAVRLGLVDTLGTFEDAVRIAAGIAGIRGEPALVRERHLKAFWEGIFGDAGDAIRDLKQELIERPVLSYRFAHPAE